MQKIVLLPEGDIWDRPSARIVGTKPMEILDLVNVDGLTIVVKKRGRSIGGSYRRAQFEVWVVSDPGFEYDPTTQQDVMAERSFAFDQRP